MVLTNQLLFSPHLIIIFKKMFMTEELYKKSMCLLTKSYYGKKRCQFRDQV